MEWLPPPHLKAPRLCVKSSISPQTHQRKHANCRWNASNPLPGRGDDTECRTDHGEHRGKYFDLPLMWGLGRRRAGRSCSWRRSLRTPSWRRSKRTSWFWTTKTTSSTRFVRCVQVFWWAMGSCDGNRMLFDTRKWIGCLFVKHFTSHMTRLQFQASNIAWLSQVAMMMS